MVYRLYSILVIAILFLSCGKKKVDKTYYYEYNANALYTGSHPTTGFQATVYLIERESYIECQLTLSGNIDTLAYKMQIYQKDTTQTTGYSLVPFIDFGEMPKGQQAKAVDISSIDFDTFTKTLEGYFVIQDPQNAQREINTLLAFGKIGKEW